MMTSFFCLLGVAGFVGAVSVHLLETILLGYAPMRIGSADWELYCLTRRYWLYLGPLVCLALALLGVHRFWDSRARLYLQQAFQGAAEKDALAISKVPAYLLLGLALGHLGLGLYQSIHLLQGVGVVLTSEGMLARTAELSVSVLLLGLAAWAVSVLGRSSEPWLGAFCGAWGGYLVFSLYYHSLLYHPYRLELSLALLVVGPAVACAFLARGSGKSRYQLKAVCLILPLLALLGLEYRALPVPMAPPPPVALVNDRTPPFSPDPENLPTDRLLEQLDQIEGERVPESWSFSIRSRRIVETLLNRQLTPQDKRELSLRAMKWDLSPLTQSRSLSWYGRTSPYPYDGFAPFELAELSDWQLAALDSRLQEVRPKQSDFRVAAKRALVEKVLNLEEQLRGQSEQVDAAVAVLPRAYLLALQSRWRGQLRSNFEDYLTPWSLGERRLTQSFGSPWLDQEMVFFEASQHFWASTSIVYELRAYISLQLYRREHGTYPDYLGELDLPRPAFNRRYRFHYQLPAEGHPVLSRVVNYVW